MTQQTTSYLAQNIRILRKRKRMSQEQLSALLNISRSNVAAYESKGVEPRLRVIMRLAKLFDVSIRALVSDNMQVFTDRDFDQIVTFRRATATNHVVNIDGNQHFDQLHQKTKEVRSVVDGLKSMMKLRQSRVSDKGDGISRVYYWEEDLLDAIDQLVSTNEKLLNSFAYPATDSM